MYWTENVHGVKSTWYKEENNKTISKKAKKVKPGNKRKKIMLNSRLRLVWIERKSSPNRTGNSWWNWKFL